MEHRCGSRRKVAIAAALRLPSGERIAARIRDASLSGAFVDALAVRLPIFSHVELELMLPSAPDAIPCHCGALVMRTHADGAGLLFDDFSPLAMVLLFEALVAGAPQRLLVSAIARRGPELNI